VNGARSPAVLASGAVLIQTASLVLVPLGCVLASLSDRSEGYRLRWLVVAVVACVVFLFAARLPVRVDERSRGLRIRRPFSVRYVPPEELVAVERSRFTVARLRLASGETIVLVAPVGLSAFLAAHPDVRIEPRA
jgi:Bacterial PH domain